MSDYAHPEVLVSTDWVATHAKDPGVRLVEVDVDTSAYDQGHIEGASAWNWQTELQDALLRDLAEPKAFEALRSEERRVGKECGCRGARGRYKKKQKMVRVVEPSRRVVL